MDGPNELNEWLEGKHAAPRLDEDAIRDIVSVAKGENKIMYLSKKDISEWIASLKAGDEVAVQRTRMDGARSV